MPDKLKYKNFMCIVKFSADHNVFFGKIEGINDLVSFEENTVNELNTAFEEPVDDYLELHLKI